VLDFAAYVAAVRPITGPVRPLGEAEESS